MNEKSSTPQETVPVRWTRESVEEVRQVEVQKSVDELRITPAQTRSGGSQGRDHAGLFNPIDPPR
jgi:hypothetical protein